MKKTGLKLGKDFQAVAVSIDPNEDGKDRAHRRAGAPSGRGTRKPRRLAVPDGFGGYPNAAQRLADAVGFGYKYDPETKQFAHVAAAFVFTPKGKISRYLYGIEIAERDLRLALVEASEGRVGTTLDQVLLACFRYDPMSQKYTPYVVGFVQIGAGLSALALITLLAILWRRELLLRRRKAA